jgi:hypothetical protein
MIDSYRKARRNVVNVSTFSGQKFKKISHLRRAGGYRQQWDNGSKPGKVLTREVMFSQ